MPIDPSPAPARGLLRALLVWLALGGLGVGIVILPDTGPRLVSLSAGHGPSLVDAAGVVLLLAGWVVYLRALWLARARIRHRWTLAGLIVGGSVTAAWSVLDDRGGWWVLGVTVAVLAQVAAGLTVVTGGGRETISRRRSRDAP